MESNVTLRGGTFLNRYRIEGTLTTASPLHIGNGNCESRRGLYKKIAENKEEPIKISTVERVFSGLPYIPGSTLRGNIRHWLIDVLRSFGPKIASDHNYEMLLKESKYKNQNDQIEFMRKEASLVERLFGSPFSNSKVDIWDSVCLTDPTTLTWAGVALDSSTPPYWIKERLTYIGQSVAIDPETGTALDKKLYHFEIVPKGIKFKLVICGQNLSDIEVGMLVLALEGFNSQIFPLTLGAMNNRGFGRFLFVLTKIYRLENDRMQIRKWLESALTRDDAGFEALETFEDISKYQFIDALKKEVGSLNEAPHA